MLITIEQEALDLWRYYEWTEQYVDDYSNIGEYILFCIVLQNDFIYWSLLWLACKLGISMDFITVFYISLYYTLSLKIVMCHFRKFSIPFIIIASSFLFAPFIWVQCISRNLAAIAVSYFAIKEYLDGKYKKAFLFYCLAIMTHISMVIYLPIFCFAHFLKGVKLKRVTVVFLLLSLLLISFFVPSFLMGVFSLLASDSETRYASYGDISVSGVLSATNIGYGDKFPIFFDLFYSFVLLILNRKFDFMYWCLFFLTCCLSFFIFSSLMFTNRFIMVSNLFIVWNTVSIYTSDKKAKPILFYVSIVGILSVMLHFYSYREVFGF